jgi:hypothetical protein
MAQAHPMPEEGQQSTREAMASMPVAPPADAKKEPPERKRAESRLQASGGRNPRESQPNPGWRSTGTTSSPADGGDLQYPASRNEKAAPVRSAA